MPLSLYISSLLLVRMHVYMTSTMLRPLASYTHTPVLLCVYLRIHSCSVHTICMYYTLPFFVYVYIHIPNLPVYYTVHAPYHHCGYSAASYTSPCALPSIHLFPIHISTSITCHMTCHHIISSSMILCIITFGIRYMACYAITRSVPPLWILCRLLHISMCAMILPSIGYLHILHILISIESMESMESMIWTI